MNKLFIFALVALLTVCAWAENGLSVSQQVDNMLFQGRYADGEIVVKYTEGSFAAMNVNTSAVKDLGNNTFCMKLRGDMKKTLVQLLQDPSVQYAEPNYLYKTMAVPNDAKFGQLWGMKKIGAPEAWNTKSKGNGILVAVIDTGINYKHEDLKDNVWVNEAEANGKAGVDDDGNGYVDDIHGMSGITQSGDPMDDQSHGSHCSGTIGGSGNNGIGVAGVCWEAEIMGCKFLGADGSGSLEGAVLCINYAVANGAKVLSNSWGGGGFSVALYDAIKNAQDAGVLFVAAAGNSYNGELSYPANYCLDTNHNGTVYKGLDNVLSVAASDQNDSKASFSQYSVEAAKAGKMIAAPGTSILSTVLGNDYASYDGTSMATPHVAGAATLVWSNNPNLTAIEVKNLLVNSGDTLEWSADWWGPKFNVQRLNLNNAVKQSK
ncbi:S8 family peptidase [Candidatus Uabimicrobium sp. HlEnr_7]|uniref:S8 family peptidase n=1 Tax=Candidatus Uabimicrobium helgolandensis TaxID=3095367 RepID=UPI003557AF9B